MACLCGILELFIYKAPFKFTTQLCLPYMHDDIYTELYRISSCTFCVWNYLRKIMTNIEKSICFSFFFSIYTDATYSNITWITSFWFPLRRISVFYFTNSTNNIKSTMLHYHYCRCNEYLLWLRHDVTSTWLKLYFFSQIFSLAIKTLFELKWYCNNIGWEEFRRRWYFTRWIHNKERWWD